MKRRNIILLNALLGAALLTSAMASRVTAATLLVKAAKVHTVSGKVLEPGAVLVRDGRIEEVATDIAAKVDKTVDLGPLQLFPGLIAADTDLGLVEINSVRASVDTREVGEFTPDVVSWVAVNPDSDLIPVARANGITHAHIVPAGGVVAGQSGVLALSGWTWEEMSAKRPAALHIYWPSMGLDTRTEGERKPKSLEDQARDRAKKLKELDDFFAEAEAYAKARGASTNAPIVPAWEAMIPYVRRELPLVVHAEDLRQIKGAMAWAEQRNFKIILSGGRDAWQVADELAKRKIPVIYTSVFTLPDRTEEAYDVYFRAPSVLAKAGVLLAIMQGGSRMSGEAWAARNLPFSAAQAAAFGLPEAEAIQSITLNPAKILGLDQQLGSIEPGKQATFIAVEGSILDIRANVRRMWISGKEVSLETRQTQLFEKYRTRPAP